MTFTALLPVLELTCVPVNLRELKEMVDPDAIQLAVLNGGMPELLCLPSIRADRGQLDRRG